MPSIADDRLMQQVRDLTGALDTIKALLPKRVYNLRTSREDVALSAQGSQVEIPELVSAGADGYLNIDYERLSVFLIGAAKELAARQGALDAMRLKRFDRMFALGQAEGFAKLALSRTLDGDLPDGSKGFKFTFGPSTAKAGVRAVRGEVDAPIEGYAVTVRIDSTSDTEGQHTLQAISTTADSRGDSRGHVRG